MQAVDITALLFAGCPALTSALSAYCSRPVGETADPVCTRARAWGMLLEGSWRGWNQLPFEPTRAEALTALLASKGWTPGQVQARMGWRVLPRDDLGFLSTDPRAGLVLSMPGGGPVRAFKSVNGFVINRATGSVELLLEPATSTADALFDWNDVKEVLERGLVAAAFSLDPPDHEHLPFHPFQELRFQVGPSQLDGSSLLATMLHADLLLKTLSTGVEVSASPPFLGRSVAASLIRRVPANLRSALHSVQERAGLRRDSDSNRAHRF